MSILSSSDERVEDSEDNDILEFAQQLAADLVDEAVCEAVVFRAFEDSSDTDTPLEKKPPEHSTASKTNAMVILGRVLLAVLLIYPAIYHVISSGGSPVRHAPPPRPFFSNSSRRYVADYHDGNAVIDRIRSNNKITIVMYYAPWDRKSVELRHPYEVVARLFANEQQVKFAAINCFVSSGECRRAYRMFTYPVIIAYAGKASAVFQGEHEIDHLYRWVERLLNPVDFVNTDDEFSAMTLQNDYSVIGYFPVKKGQHSFSFGMRRFSACAFQSNTGHASRQRIRFGITTNKQFAASLGLDRHVDVLLQTLDGERHYFSEEMTAESLDEWLRGHAHSDQAMHHISFNRHEERDTHFSTLLTKSPALLLFTNEQILYKNSMIEFFREVSARYWSCSDRENPTPPISSFNDNLMDDDRNECRLASVQTETILECCRLSINRTQMGKICASHDACSSGGCDNRYLTWSAASERKCSVLEDFPLSDIVQICCDNLESIWPDARLHDQLREESKKLREKARDTRCTRGRLAEHLGYRAHFSTSRVVTENEPEMNSIQGLGCNSGNASLQFAFLDSRLYPFFARKWGLNGTTPSAIIIDNSRELFSVSHFQNRSDILRLMLDYHDHLLDDNMLSEEARQSAFVFHDHALAGEETQASSSVVIKRLTEKTFKDAIANKGDSVVLFSGGSWHAPSASIIHIVHSVAQFFRASTDDLLNFYMIDASRNELPYNFNFDSYPTLVLFNGKSNELSWKFPSDTPFTMPNLISFILSHCSHNLRIRMAFEMCDAVCVTRGVRHLRRHAHWLTSRVRSFRESTGNIRSHLSSTYNDLIIKKQISQLRIVRRLISTLRSDRHLTKSMLSRSEHAKAAEILSSLGQLPSIY